MRRDERSRTALACEDRLLGLDVDLVVLEQGILTDIRGHRPRNKRKYIVNEIAETVHVSRKTIYRHLGSTTSTPPGPEYRNTGSGGP